MNEFLLRKVVENYATLSDEELMTELVKQVATQQKKDGGENMKQVIERIRPMLNDEQREKLDKVLSELKIG